ncbi:Exodeoxyribonuclease 8 [Ralstonia solanacearum]|nr:Exodeoxyribonuclease 8 [Ralstonia solanacearum]NKF72417.1 Exodeoxyribonuclease 8 [Ralstonia solanacearum]
MNAPLHADTVWSGLIHGVPINDYHAMPGASKSVLDAVAQSPAIAYARNIDPARPPQPEKAGQLEGQIAHCAILEPNEFDKRYVVGPDWNRNTNKWKDYVAQMEADRPGVVILKQEQYETAMCQAAAVHRLPEVAEALARGYAEVTARWIDQETRAQCRCRPDWAHPCGDAGAILLDVKTYSNASADEFARQAARKRYHVQDAFYSDGFELASGLEVYAFIFVAVEDAYPFAANAVMLEPQSKERGRVLYRRDLRTYAECMRYGVWPGYSNQIQLITLPAWAFQD